jgi:FtsH-binding integral membrane protein
MDNYNNYNFSQTQTPAEGTIAKAFMANVFSWMFLALTITAVTSYVFGTVADLREMLFQFNRPTPLFYIAVFAPIIVPFVISIGFERLSFGAIVGMFVIYSFLIGMSLSFIFMAFPGVFIFKTFAITAGAFGGMALLGYTTKTDLTRLGAVLYMALFGVIIASIVMMFTGGDTFIIDLLCVVIFTGLAAFKVQMLKNLGEQAGLDSVNGRKLAVWGALSLYITFINLFLTLLRLFARR